MGESFELAFFASRDSLATSVANRIKTALGLNTGRNSDIASALQLFKERDVWFDIVEGDDFAEYLIAVENCRITNDNLDKYINQICELVDICFRVAPEIQFATGIYELTGYYLRNASSLFDVRELFFPHAPFLFFRLEQEFGYSATKYSNNLFYSFRRGDKIQNVI